MPDPRLKNILQRTMGLSLQTVGQGFIDRSVKSRMSAAGVTADDAYADLVESNPLELQALIESIVVPETWFFRDEEAFAALADWAINEWAPTHPDATLRVLSLPCSTGEEAYSIAMCLTQAGLALSQFHVTGMDISNRNLVIAKAGVYRPNAFRGGDQKFQSNFFEQTPAGLRVNEDIRGRLDFQPGNVLESLDEFTSGAFDVIFFRNLLIYFNRETQTQTLENIERLLAKDGVLFVGSAEAFVVQAFGCQPLSHSMSFGFRRCRQAPDPPVVKKGLIKPEVKPVRVVKTATVSRLWNTPVSTAPSRRPKRLPVQADVDDELELARRFADKGDLAQARKHCKAAIARYGPCVECYFLMGLIEDAENQPEKAADYYRKVLYLEPNHKQALEHMALIADRLGDAKNAARLRTRGGRNMGSGSVGGKE
ncbi:MAG: CheR family methyltransferase [Candidatus Sumerlaeaceae bacterium]